MVPALTFSEYDLLELLHEGTNTVIYRGRLTRGGPCSDLVILKILKADYPTLDQISQLKHEYQIAKNLASEGVVKVHQLCVHQNRLALVYEDFGGRSLKQFLDQRSLPLDLFLKIAVQLAQGLLSLHQHSILHKDVKPDNIIINPQTGQVKLTDFSIASSLNREALELDPLNQLEGTLAYMSPEQTGRMNRAIDYRSDFYALGITFYEMLTGQLPFPGDDPLELVYCHIAKQPVAIQQLNPQVPQMLGAIVSKLMAKNADDRYQSAAGLKADLEFCLNQFHEKGAIPNGVPGLRDRAGQLLIPQKLYGREREVQTLLAAFDRVAGGSEHSCFLEPVQSHEPTSELMLVSGYSGIGKSSLVHEVHQSIVRRHGYFITGKFDQFNRNVPYASLIQALRSLMQQLLTESVTQLQTWQDKLQMALKNSGQVIINVIPEAELLIGRQPAVPELGAIETQNRFNQVFQSFIQVFAQVEHPLVLFLDDLQWADLASLRLIQVLMNPESHHLLLIGAYRDQDVDQAHPLTRLLEDIQQAGAIVHTIFLQPLERTQVEQIVAETLGDSDRTLALAELLFHKTQGNPFFLTQLLKAFHQSQLLTFDFAQGCWQWELEAIQMTGIADQSVVELVASNLVKLPELTQTVLQVGACLGDRFNISTLATVNAMSCLNTARALHPALQAGWILPLNSDYKIPLLFADEELEGLGFDPTQVAYRFLHDRVQQAAYSLIPEAQKQATHLRVGQMLWQYAIPEEVEAHIFEIVNSLNLGAILIADPAEKTELAQLNLIAGQKAKAAAAYELAVNYLSQGLTMLSPDSWQSAYKLTLSLHVQTAEAAYLSTDYKLSEQLVALIEHHAATNLDKIKAYELKIQSHIAQLKMWEAIATGLEALAMLGIAIASPLDRPHGQLQLPDLAALDSVPVMSDPTQLAALRILSALTSAAYQTQPEIYRWIVLTQLELCLESGHSPLAAFAYTAYAWFCGTVGAADRAYQAGQMALRLIEQFQAKELQCSFHQLFESFVRHQKEHIRATIPWLQESIQIGLETGELAYVSYSAMNLSTHLFFSGESLDSLEQAQLMHVELLLKLKQEFQIYYVQLWRQVTLNLQGKAANWGSLTGESFDEALLLPRLQAAQNHQSLFGFYSAKSILNYLFQNYQQAIENAERAEPYAGSGAGLVLSAVYWFYYSLALLARCQQPADLDQVRANQQAMQSWAKSAPMNYQHKYDLVAAELARVEGRIHEAMTYYDQAIEGAIAHGYIQEAALASERAAQFYLARGKKHIAQGYMTEAYYGYIQWGAIAKVHQLEAQYHSLLIRSEVPHADIKATETFVLNRSQSKSSVRPDLALDLATVMKAAQAISSELHLHQLLEKLLSIILENATAQKGCLILEKDGKLFIEAISVDSHQAVLQSIPIEDSRDIPISLIHYVARTKQPLVLTNAADESISRSDPYVIERQPKSILCNPVLYQRKLIGILYLENNLVADSFNRDRLDLLKFLTTQAAIAIENARLYSREQEKSRQLQESIEQLQQTQIQLVQSEKMATLGNLVSGIAHEINNPIGFLKGNLKNAEGSIQDLLKHVDYYQRYYPDPFPNIRDHAAAIDLAFLTADLPKMTQSMKMAIDRIRNISVSLRTFSRLDTDQKIDCNIHEGLDSTLLILKYRLQSSDRRPAIEVIRNYGDLPRIRCFPGQLNQVFMNILANAIDALDEVPLTAAPHPRQITVTTRLSTDQAKVVIKIRDNGPGIPKNIQARIFDHLFTTKGVGKGTGFGLSIAQQIVEETHQGRLSYTSEPGQGTAFTIEIPV